MEIRDQMTATVRLTKQAAQRLSAFLGSLKTQPKNMNDALNLALSDLPVPSFIGEITALQQDERKSLLDIAARHRSAGLLKRSDYYFMILMAKQALWASKKERVHHQSIQTVLEMTLTLWDLCKNRDEGHERYMLGNLNGSGTSQSLETYIPTYMERSKKHPYRGTLEFALRNPEVMLRDDLVNINDAVIHERLRKYFGILYGMAVRRLFLETRQPLIPPEDQGYLQPIFSDNFGPDRILHFIQGQDKNFGFAIALTNINIAANNIVEAEELFDAFSPLDESDLNYRGENFSLLYNEHINVNILFQTRILQTWITRQEYDKASKAIADMLADARIQTALNDTHERFGTL